MFACAFMSMVVLVIGVLVVQRATALAASAGTITAAAVRHTMQHAATAPKQQLAMVTPLDELSALAANGNGKAQLLIGLKYLKGEDGPKKPEEAAQWIGRAAQRGEPMAQYWAGYIYQHGIGVSADQDEAMHWYEAAADQGNMKAMYNLGVGYAQGWAGARDVPEASRWFTRAARFGFVDAQFNLAVLYERGQGVPSSLSDAYKWYAVAARNGDTESKKRLAAIVTQLDADDLAAAQRSADTFRPTPTVPEANTLPVLDQKRM
jgi:localization factor PodJL